jgi:hypothetical protein
MTNTFRSLVAATAAAAALSLIPLASAGASTTVPTSTTSNWAGYYMTRPGLTTYLGHRYQPRLDAANAMFTVPTGQRAHSAGKSVYEGAMWAGLGGYAKVHGRSESLEQAGVVELAGKTGPQRYMIFWEMYPSNHEQNFNGHPVYVKPGDKIQAFIQTPLMSGTGAWIFRVTVNGKPYIQSVPASKYHTDEPTTAEVITEWAGGIAGIGPRGIAGKAVNGMPNTGIVRYDYAGALVQYTVPQPVPVTQHRLVLDNTIRVWKNPVAGWVPQRTLVFPTAAQATGEFGPGRLAFNTIYTSA